MRLAATWCRGRTSCWESQLPNRALLEIRALPWRPRARVMKPDTLRQHADPTALIGEDLTGVVIGLVLLIVILVAAPLIVVVLAVALLPWRSRSCSRWRCCWYSCDLPD